MRWTTQSFPGLREAFILLFPLLMSLSKLCNLPFLAGGLPLILTAFMEKVGWYLTLKFSEPLGPLKPLAISEKKGNSRELQKLKNESKIATNNDAGG